MEHKSFKNVLGSLDYTIVDNNSQFLGIDNLETIREYLLDKRDGEYKHIEIYVLPYNLWQIKYIIENNFKFNNEQIRVEYNKLRRKLNNWFSQCNTQKDAKDDADIIK